MPTDAIDVFISYKREERRRVEQLALRLSELQLAVWYDMELAAGERWSEAIERTANSAACVVACWTREAAASEWVLREIDIGLKRNVLVLARMDDHPLPPALASLHCADLSGWKGDMQDLGIRQLVKGIGLHIQEPIEARYIELIEGRNPAAVTSLRKLLVRLARRRETITYGKAFDAISSAYANGDKTTWPTFFATLDAIADQNRMAREPPLFGLVVKSDTGIPGKGYFQKHSFLEGEHGEIARAIHRTHLDRIFNFPWRDDD